MAYWVETNVTVPQILWIVEEQISVHTFVEPNVDHRYTFFRLCFNLLTGAPVDVWFDLH
ncbi:hypothetical protein MK139_13330 [bacterium]|nr:hypothetical protein [bacterium]